MTQVVGRVAATMNVCNINFISWNVRGLNMRAKRNVVRESVVASQASVACIQETKLHVIDSPLVMETLGPSFDGFSYLPSSQNRGGILLAWNSSRVTCTAQRLQNHSITAKVLLPNDSSSWVSAVYGPSKDVLKPEFLQELCDKDTCLVRG